MMNNMDELNDKFKKSAENFSLIPSSGIWKKVEADILKRKRKRRFIIFFFLFAGILTGGIFLFNDHTRNTSIQTSLQKTNSTSTDHHTTIQNISTKKNNEVKDTISAPQTYSHRNDQDRSIEIVSQPNQPSNSVRSATTNTITPATTQTTANQNNFTAINQQEIQITTPIATIIPPVTSDSVKSSSVTAISKDSLQPETRKDSLPATLTDTINKDSSVTLKDTITIVPRQNWSIAIGVAPTLSYTTQQEQGNYQFISNYRDSSDKNLPAWNYHLSVNYHFLPQLELFTGIGIINFEQDILSHQAVYKYDTTYATTLPIPHVTIIRGYFNIHDDSTGTVKNKITYLEIPIGIRYNFLPGKKFNISLQPEISFNKMVAATGYLYNYQTFSYEKINKNDLQDWMAAYGAGIVFQYAIQTHFKVELIPGYHSYQKSIYKSSYPVSQKFQQAEIRFSLRYIFK